MRQRTDVRRAARAALAATALGGLAAAAPAARADERDDKIRELENLVRQQAEEQARLRHEVDALKAAGATGVDDTALRAAVAELVREERGQRSYVGPGGVRRPLGDLQFGGYFSTRYFNSELPDAKPSFQDMRLVLQMHAPIARAITFDGEVEFEHGGIGGGADGEVVIEYAQIRFSECDEFAFKAGTLLAPWGRFNSEHDDPLNELSSRPTVSRLVHGVVLRGPGIGVEGSVEASDDMMAHYDVVLTNGLADSISSGSGIRGARTLWEDDENHDKTLFGRFGVTPDVGLVDALDLGASFAYGKLGEAGDDDMRGYGFDVATKWGPWEARGEWAHLGIDRDDAAAPPGERGSLGPVRGLQGWYGQVLYRIRDPWVRSLPFADESASVALLVRRDAVDTNDRVLGAEPADEERAWSFGVNYRPTTKTVVKFEYRSASSAFPGKEGESRDAIAVEFATYF